MSNAKPLGPLPVDKAVDFANYFCTYAFLYHQKEMLSDRVRMDAYHSAIFSNRKHFQGKTVLDVGTGSGILAIWSAQAGAKKVYAVEATNMAVHARTLAQSNGVGHIVEVIQGSVEEVSIPEKVDVIVSEWMGYFLLRESMFDSVIYARDKWLKPSGLMYPSHARMWLAPVNVTKTLEHKKQEYQKSMVDWSLFTQETTDVYGVDMSALTAPFDEEQKKYYLRTALWSTLYPEQVLADPVVIKEMDCHTATLKDIAAVESEFNFTLAAGKLCAFAGWFDVHFRGNADNAAVNEVELTTAPSETDTTHWGQQVFLLSPPLLVQDGDVIVGSLDITRSRDNHRLMDVKITYQLKPSGQDAPHPPTVAHFCIE